MNEKYLEPTYKRKNKSNIESIPLIYPNELKIEIGENIPEAWTNKLVDLIFSFMKTQESSKYSIYLSEGTKDKYIQTYTVE